MIIHISLSISITVDDTSKLESNTLFNDFVDVVRLAETHKLPVKVSFQHEQPFVPIDVKKSVYYQALLRMIKK